MALEQHFKFTDNRLGNINIGKHLSPTDLAPGTVLVLVLTHLILPMIPRGRNFCLTHFTGEETEILMGKLTCLKLYS